MAKKKEEPAFNFIEELERAIGGIVHDTLDLGIIDFIDQRIDAYDMKTLLGNRVVMKAFFMEPLDDEEQALMDKWIREEKTNWVDPRQLVQGMNLQRIVEGEEPIDVEDPVELRKAFAWRELVVEGGMRGGKSLKGDTLVPTNQGLLRFDELLPQAKTQNDEVHCLPSGLAFQTMDGARPVFAGVSEVKQETLRLVTRNGFEVEGSLVHPMLVMTRTGRLAWKTLPEIAKGDFLCIHRPTQGLFGHDGASPAIARVLGYLTSTRGRVTRRGFSIELEREAAEFCETTLAEYCSVHRLTGRTQGVRANGQAARTLLAQWGIGDGVPGAVRRGSREAVRQYLKALFDVDGETRESGKRISIELPGAPTLLRGVQALLLQFGIVAAVKEDIHGPVLSLFGAEASRLESLLGERTERSEKKPGADIIPHLGALLHRAGTLVHESGTKKQIDDWECVKRQIGRTRRRTDPEDGISYGDLDRVIGVLAGVERARPIVDHFERLRTYRFFYDPVVAVSRGEAYLYDAEVPDNHNFIANGLVSHNTQIGAFITLYLFAQLISTPRDRWREVFGIPLPMGTPLYMTCIAATADSTEKTIYGQICSYMTGSKFFKRYIDEGRLIVTSTEISFPESNLQIVAGNSRAASQVGRVAMLVALDEIAFHQNSDGKSNAKDIYDRIGRSTTNLGRVAKIVSISSVKEDGDFMEELQRESWDKQHLGCLCFRLASWDLNETLSMDSPVIAKAYAADPVTAARDYENIRPAAEGAFLNAALVDMAVDHPNEEKIKFRRGYHDVSNRLPNGKTENRRFVTLEIDQIDQLPPPPAGMFSVGHCDPGVSDNSFAFACGHAESFPQGIATVIDFCLDWIPITGTKGQVYKVDFVNVEEVVLQVHRARNLMRLTYDHWQGEDHIQRLWRAGVPAYTDNFNGPRQLAGYLNFRDRLNAGLVKIPNHPTLVEELKNLILKNGTKVDHPKKKSTTTKRDLSKDLADCIMAVDSYISMYGAAFARTPQQATGLVAPRSNIQVVGKTNASQINWDRRRR